MLYLIAVRALPIAGERGPLFVAAQASHCRASAEHRLGLWAYSCSTQAAPSRQHLPDKLELELAVSGDQVISPPSHWRAPSPGNLKCIHYWFTFQNEYLYVLRVISNSSHVLNVNTPTLTPEHYKYYLFTKATGIWVVFEKILEHLEFS